MGLVCYFTVVVDGGAHKGVMRQRIDLEGGGRRSWTKGAERKLLKKRKIF